MLDCITLQLPCYAALCHVTLCYAAYYTVISCYTIASSPGPGLGTRLMLYHIACTGVGNNTCLIYTLHQVIKALSGPPNYWDMDRIENNMFKKYKRKDLDGTLYDSKSIMHYA